MQVMFTQARLLPQLIKPDWEKFDNVIVISPSHRDYFAGISIYNGDAYKTPLGEIIINKELCDEIISESEIF